VLKFGRLDVVECGFKQFVSVGNSPVLVAFSVKALA
jgi:hypothetical protein